MAWYQVLGLLIGMLLVFMAIGMPVVFAFLAANLIGAWIFMGGEIGVMQLVRNAADSVQSFALLPIPLFIFMGEILFQSGIMSTIYRRAATAVSGIPGGLLQANIAACTIFAACSGSSVASAATIGSVGYPEIAQRNYNRPIALGSIAAGGTLGILIPPSIIFIIYGIFAEVSIVKLLLAGILPGLLTAVVYMIMIVGRAWLNPKLAPPVEFPDDRTLWRERWASLGEICEALKTEWGSYREPARF